jgi:hypothetical protein
MNSSNYGEFTQQQQQVLIKKNRKKKGGANTGYASNQAKTPMDFESSMSSNSALVMMDGGTGSEHINFRQQQMLLAAQAGNLMAAGL